MFNLFKKEEKKEYIIINRNLDRIEEATHSAKYVIIPIENINYIFNTDIYDENYNKYKNRITIQLKDGTKHKIYELDKVIFATENDVEARIKM